MIYDRLAGVGGDAICDVDKEVDFNGEGSKDLWLPVADITSDGPNKNSIDSFS